ncbi:VOC family protein [Paraglaciecola arctica]|uniref:VOC family protein n=1 Tax=Paraglaciecola arctica TaxID=1128911 RepID=UPI001C07BEA4|nr:VOC family protein [Paraglaciecola arctica]MBU3002986.1 VOC family protein [Paraglaciecola arctica]
MQNRLEHINLTVSNTNNTAAILGDIFDWQIRWQGPAKDNGHTIHLGGNDTYLALYSHKDKHYSTNDHKTVTKLNHIGIVVDDLAKIEQRVIAKGFIPYNHADYEPGKRFYFNIEDNVEIEVVSYM